MKILIAPDKFKGSIEAGEAALLIRGGLLSVIPDLEVACVPMADGGEGTGNLLAGYRGLEPIQVEDWGKRIDHPLIGKYFERFDGHNYVMNNEMKEKYPAENHCLEEWINATRTTRN